MSRIFTVKAVAGGSVEQMVSVNSAGFRKEMPISRAAKEIVCDEKELLLQLQKRQGMTHVVRRKHRHWYT